MFTDLVWEFYRWKSMWGIIKWNMKVEKKFFIRVHFERLTWKGDMSFFNEEADRTLWHSPECMKLSNLSSSCTSLGIVEREDYITVFNISTYPAPKSFVRSIGRVECLCPAPLDLLYVFLIYVCSTFITLLPFFKFKLMTIRFI